MPKSSTPILAAAVAFVVTVTVPSLAFAQRGGGHPSGGGAVARPSVGTGGHAVVGGPVEGHAVPRPPGQVVYPGYGHV